MPSNVRRFFTSIFLVLITIVGAAFAQAPPANPSTTTAQNTPLASVEKQPTSAEIMRERISKAKAYIAVRNYNAAIYELENIRRESSDQSVNAVANVLLMNSYLEQGDHKRAQIFLNEFFKSYKSNSAAGNMYYSSVAAQVIKGARNQVERYRALGLNVSDRNLPLEAVNDIERMRETLELVIAQAKELGADKNKAGAAMAILEEATNSRSMIARDDYDARRWRDELGDSREQMASSRSVVINAVDGTTVANPVPQDVATNGAVVTPTNPSTQTVKPATQLQDTTAKPNEKLVASNNAPPVSVPPPPTASNNEPARPRVADSKPITETATPNVQTETPKQNPESANVQTEAPKQNSEKAKPKFQTVPPKQTDPVEEPKPNSENAKPKFQTVPPKQSDPVEEQKQNAENAKPKFQTVPPKQSDPVEEQKQLPDQQTVPTADGSGLMDVGSLMAYATKQQAPIYPPMAKNMRASGVVKVEVTVSETGDVAEVHKLTGPTLLQTAAKDAIRKWKFKPFTRDGQPVKATGFVNFNFSL